MPCAKEVEGLLALKVQEAPVQQLVGVVETTLQLEGVVQKTMSLPATVDAAQVLVGIVYKVA